MIRDLTFSFASCFCFFVGSIASMVHFNPKYEISPISAVLTMMVTTSGLVM